MYLFRIFYSLLPLRNPIGFGGSDLLILAIAVLMVVLLLAKAWLTPYLFKLASQTRLCMVTLFALAIVLRLALLPHSPEPIPSGADDFGYLLLGDTIAHFRFANPPHVLHQFFESVFILQQPTYASIYPLAQGFVLALINPWFGVLLSSGAFCALCYWMLRAWASPIWALTGGLLTIIQFGPLSTWVNSYWGGYVSACAGCLVFGALPRLRKGPQLRNGILLGLGLSLQILSRPFEATFLALAIVLWLAATFLLKQPWKPLAAALAPLSFALLLVLLQNKAVTKRWPTMPYVLSRYQYGVPTTLTFQPNPIPHRQLTAEQEFDYKAQSAIHGSHPETFQSYTTRLIYRFRYLRFFLLPPLFLAVLFIRRHLWALGIILLFALGTNFYPYFYPHYIAALTCLFILLSIAGLQRMDNASRQLVLVLCFASFAFWFGVYALADPAVFAVTDYQSWNYINTGDPQGRVAINSQLRNSPGQQLVFVRYAPFHRFEEWVHNDADIEHSQTVWANDLGSDENRKLLHYYPNRTPWLLEPDVHPPALKPYSTDTGIFETVH